MICLKCNTENSEEANFCNNCGSAISYTQVSVNDRSNQSVLFLLIILGWHYFFIIIWQFVPTYITKNNIDGPSAMSIYKYLEWFGSGSTILMMLIFALIIKNNTARMFLFVLLFIRIAMIIASLMQVNFG